MSKTGIARKIQEPKPISYMKGKNPTEDGIYWLYDMLDEVQLGQQDHEEWNEAKDGQEQRAALVGWLESLLIKEVKKINKRKGIK